MGLRLCRTPHRSGPLGANCHALVVRYSYSARLLEFTQMARISLRGRRAITLVTF
jgi:hypothetical protein